MPGYEIHHGVAEVTDPAAEAFLDGCRRAAVWGTSWHGVLENDEFRRAFLAEVAARRPGFTPAPGTSFAAVREVRLDVLADLVARHLDTAALSGGSRRAGARAAHACLIPQGSGVRPEFAREDVSGLLPELVFRILKGIMDPAAIQPSQSGCTTSTSGPNAAEQRPSIHQTAR